MIALSTAPLCSMLLASHLNSQADGTFTISLADNSVVSVQPDGTIQYRPAGADGPYERCTIDGSLALFNPDGKVAYRFSISLKVP